MKRWLSHSCALVITSERIQCWPSLELTTLLKMTDRILRLARIVDSEKGTQDFMILSPSSSMMDEIHHPVGHLCSTEIDEAQLITSQWCLPLRVKPSCPSGPSAIVSRFMIGCWLAPPSWKTLLHCETIFNTVRVEGNLLLWLHNYGLAVAHFGQQSIPEFCSVYGASIIHSFSQWMLRATFTVDGFFLCTIRVIFLQKGMHECVL